MLRPSVDQAGEPSSAGSCVGRARPRADVGDVEIGGEPVERDERQPAPVGRPGGLAVDRPGRDSPQPLSVDSMTKTSASRTNAIRPLPRPGGLLPAVRSRSGGRLRG